MKGLNEMNNAELSALLTGNPNAGQLLGGAAGGAQQFGGLQQQAARAPGADQFAQQAAARNPALLQQFLMQQQAEEQQKALFQQQLAALGGGLPSGLGSPQPDNFALLLQQHQLQQGLQGGFPGQANPLAALFGGAGMMPQAQQPSLGGMRNQQFDQLALAKMLQAQQQQVNPVSDLQSAQLAALGAVGSLPLPPDRRRKGRTGTFPQKLHQMLSDLEAQGQEGADIASFLAHGRAFAIHKPRDFVKTVMPKYFRMSRFSSFQRQLNLYDFQRITDGPDKGKKKAAGLT